MKTSDIPHVNRASIIIAEKHNIGLEKSLQLMNRAKLFLVANEKIKKSVPLQAAFLTAVNAGKRTFLGGIDCFLDDSVPNLLPLSGKSFNELVKRYGGDLVSTIPDSKVIKLVFGMPCLDSNSIEVVSSGWQAGVNFYNQKRNVLKSVGSSTTIGGVSAASLGLFYAFNRAFKVIDSLIETSTGLSLWDLNSKEWYSQDCEGPTSPYIPARFWNVGLGHLGQSYLWTLGLMCNSNSPFRTILQDNDLVGKENLGSQVLCEAHNIDEPKARVCSEFLTALGMKTQIIEKPFLNHDQKASWSNDYKILLNGVDNVETRRDIDAKRFRLFLDGGTNGRLDLFDSFTMRNFSLMEKCPKKVWIDTNVSNEIIHKNLYDRIQKEHGCGQLINKTISTPFVGLFGAGLLISELIRSLNKGKAYSSLSIQMRDLSSIRLGSIKDYGNELIELAV